MLRIEAMTWQSHFPNTDRTSSLPQEANSVSSSQFIKDTKLNVAQNHQPCTSIGNSTQDSLAWNWNKKSFLSRVVSWIKGEVGFVAYNNKVVVRELKEDNTSEDAQKFNNINKLFGATDVSFFKRLKAVVCGDELKEVEMEFESAKMEFESAKKMQKMDAYLSDFFVFCEDLRKSENGINFLSNNFISDLCEQISNLEEGMKNLFKDSSIDIDTKLEFKSKLLDDLIKLLDDKFTLGYSSKGMMSVSIFFNKDKVGPLKNLLFLKSRLEVYKQATQGHLYQAKMPDGRINYILIGDEKELKDYQLKNDSKIEFLKVLGENVSLDEKLRFKVEVDDDLTGKTKIIEVPKVMDLIEFQNDEDRQKYQQYQRRLVLCQTESDRWDAFKAYMNEGGWENIKDFLMKRPIWEYLKIDPAKITALKNWNDSQEQYFQNLLGDVIQGTGTAQDYFNFRVSYNKSTETKLLLGSMLFYKDEPIYREQNRKLFQLMQKNEDLYDIMLENAERLLVWNLKSEEQKTILWKMFTAQWRRDFLEGRATISRR